MPPGSGQHRRVLRLRVRGRRRCAGARAACAPHVGRPRCARPLRSRRLRDASEVKAAVDGMVGRRRLQWYATDEVIGKAENWVAPDLDASATALVQCAGTQDVTIDGRRVASPTTRQPSTVRPPAFPHRVPVQRQNDPLGSNRMTTRAPALREPLGQFVTVTAHRVPPST